MEKFHLVGKAEPQTKAGGVIMLHEPQFEKIAARSIVQRFLGYALPVVILWQRNDEPSEEIFRQWLEGNLIPIDIGQNKYHTRGTRSALESIIEDYEIPLEPALKQLLEIVNKNNLTGYLKGFHGSIVWTLRELYKLGCNQREVIGAVNDVVEAFLDAFDKPALPGEEAVLTGLVSGLIGKDFLKSNFAPFTIPRYMRDLWRLGVPVEEIVRRAKYFAEGWQSAQSMRARTQEQLLSGENYEVFYNFEFPTGQRGGLIKTDSPYLSRELVQQFDVAIIKNSHGNVRVQTRGGPQKVYLAALARELEKQEPGRWFHDPRLPACFNGTRQYQVRPTSLNAEQFVEMIRRLVRFI